MKMKKSLILEDDYFGYFSRIMKKMGGEGIPNNLKTFEFKKEVLNQYTDSSIKNPMEFKFQDHNDSFFINHIGKWGLKCGRNRNGNIGALLIDLVNIPKEQQDWWKDHLIK